VITSKQCEIGCQFVLITNSKSHMGFRLVPTSVTLNGVILLFCIISPNFIAMLADYVKMVEDRPMMSAEYRLPPCSAISLR